MKTKTVNGFENYTISENGIVINTKRNSPLLPAKSKKGYHSVGLYKNNKCTKFFVHRLVAEMFIPKVIGKDIVNHKDGDKTNNHISNLEWVDASENRIHAVEVLNVSIDQKGTKIKSSKLDDEFVEYLLTTFLKNKSIDEVKKLCKEKGMVDGSYCKILKNQSWKHIIPEKRADILTIYTNNTKSRVETSRILKIYEPPKNGSVWKRFSGFSGKYFISDKGEVFSGVKNKICAQTTNDEGYKIITLRDVGTQKTFKVHRLVAECFLENPEDKPYVNHINCVRSDNTVSNLEWVTQEENMQKRYSL